MASRTPRRKTASNTLKTRPHTAPGGTGLRGQSAGETAICTVGQQQAGLTYRGYDIAELAEYASFEEVAYLLLRGELPDAQDLAAYCQHLQSLRALPEALKSVLEQIPAQAHPMDVMRTGCAMLGVLESEPCIQQAPQQQAAERLLALCPAMLNYWYHFSHQGVRIETETDDESLAGYFLSLLHGEPASELHDRVMNVSLILYAEHEFNASTFTARVCASTLSDIHSCVTAAIGSLRGPLHGGANEAAMAMLLQWHSVEEAEQGVLQMLARKEKIMGFGHAVYRESDPRNALIKGWAERLAQTADTRQLYDIAARVEAVMWREKHLFANADFFHAPAYYALGIPCKLFTPIFVCARMAGWCAHIFEQRANNRIIRPSADYVGPALRPWLPLDQRQRRPTH